MLKLLLDSKIKSVIKKILKLLLILLFLSSIFSLLPIRYLANGNELLKFANSLEFCESQGNSKDCILTTILVKDDFIALSFDHSIIDYNYKKAVMMSILKLYIKQKEKYGQSFEVRDMPLLCRLVNSKYALIRAYLTLLGDNYFEKHFGPDYVDASDAYVYVKNDSVLLHDIQLQALIIKIDSMNSN